MSGETLKSDGTLVHTDGSTETVSVPQIMTFKGDCIIDVLSSSKPTTMSVEYMSTIRNSFPIGLDDGTNLKTYDNQDLETEEDQDHMRIFISQPMYDKTDEEIKTKRHEVQVMFGSDAEIIDSFIENTPRDASPLWYLGEAVKKLDDADVVYFCKDWQHYRGCVIEHECAVRYGIPCIYE